MFEQRHHRLLPFPVFIRRVCIHLALALGIIGFSLLIGMAGYVYFEHMEWIDAYENAAMILSGMGPVDDICSWEGKFFAGSYALFSGVVFLVAIAIIIAPLFHRFLHRFLIKDVNS